MEDAIKERIEKDLADNKIMLYMKGTPDSPECGFSAQVISILREYKISFHTFNILENEDIRQGVKEYADWPTIPQLYVDGEFVGGCDVITELDQKEELGPILGAVKINNSAA